MAVGLNLPMTLVRPTQGNDPLHGLPYHLASELAGLQGYAGFAMNMAWWPGPVAEGTDGGITLAGVTGAATVVRAAIAGRSTIRLTTEAAADANATLLFPGQFGYSTTRKLWLMARVAVSDADDMDFHFGLGTPGVSDWVNALPTEGIFFALTEGAAVVDFVRRDNGTSTVQHASIATLADDTFIWLGFVIDKGYIKPFSGTSLNSLTWGTASNSLTNTPDDAGDELSVAFNIETGNGEADYVEIDELLVCQEV